MDGSSANVSAASIRGTIHRGRGPDRRPGRGHMLHTVRELSNRSRLRLNLLGQGLVIGLIVGVIITLYRLGITFVSTQILKILGKPADSPLRVPLYLITMALMGVLAGLCFKLAPLISGSGIPQVSAQLSGRLRPGWKNVLPFKFIGGLLTLGGGLTLGREGPSVQIGAAIGQGFGEVFKRPLTERRYLISSGASAGLAAAFNAPIAGAVFSLEELHRNFSPRALISAMVAAYTASFTSSWVMGQRPVLHFEHVQHLPLRFYGYVVLVGVVTGLSGILFNKAILFFKKIYAKLKLHWALTGVVPFMIVAVAVLILPELFGSGEEMIFLPLHGNPDSSRLALFYVLKLLLLVICFGSGLPGGIFFPMLVLGSLTGNVIGSLLNQAGLIEPRYILVLSLMAMAGHFASIVRAPMTGILLVSEMTGSFSNMLPLGIVAVVAYVIAEFCKSEPIYESLQDLLPIEEDPDPVVKTEDRMLMEFAVEEFSEVDGRLISESKWPAHFLIVAVRRGNGEMTPNGNLRTRTGDYIVGMFPRDELSVVTRRLEAMTKGLASDKALEGESGGRLRRKK